jgi:tetratricopeptide (TPR) repeat protein
LLAAGVGMLCVAIARPAVVGEFKRAKVRHDTYPLPPPEQTLLLSLGYRAALADVLFADLLVQHGLRFQQKRLLEFAGNYLDTITTLDPEFRRPYLLADTLLTMQPVAPPLAHYHKAREIFERGMRALPYDAELHITAGQYLLYLGVRELKTHEEREEWRALGTRALTRACEVLGNQPNLPFHCVHAGAMLEKAGQREAMVNFAERVLATVDDPEIRERALTYLAFAEGEGRREQAREHIKQLYRRQRADVPFVARDLYALLSPPTEVARCAGVPLATSGCGAAGPATGTEPPLSWSRLLRP